ncbi:Pleckstrin [Frankliniella fusca]|uniref:Pleckstrin n=1 Tax=Frankliniella fusca TaxID=407009 RepID=A0AAE1L520_9NEOP|nr:Pleckstrin [Frankliniella fusca]
MWPPHLMNRCPLPQTVGARPIDQCQLSRLKNSCHITSIFFCEEIKILIRTIQRVKECIQISQKFCCVTPVVKFSIPNKFNEGYIYISSGRVMQSSAGGNQKYLRGVTEDK